LDVPKSFKEDLDRVLAPLLGTSFITTNFDEFTLKHLLKLRLIDSAVKIIGREGMNIDIESIAHVKASLEVILCLVTFNNPYEFNRVLR